MSELIEIVDDVIENFRDMLRCESELTHCRRPGLRWRVHLLRADPPPPPIEAGGGVAVERHGEVAEGIGGGGERLKVKRKIVKTWRFPPYADRCCA
jgi:hypothetical protein